MNHYRDHYSDLIQPNELLLTMIDRPEKEREFLIDEDFLPISIPATSPPLPPLPSLQPTCSPTPSPSPFTLILEDFIFIKEMYIDYKQSIKHL